MAVRERRPAVWPWLVMPVIVLLVFYALHRVQHPRTAHMPAADNAGTSDSPPQ